MNKIMSNQIQKAADLVLAEFGIATPIADIDQVVTALGGVIEVVDDYGLDGTVKRLDGVEAEFAIRLVNNQSLVRKNFAVSQALGHMFLHMGYMSNWARWDSFRQIDNSIGQSDKEFETYEFAANFLMPQQHYLNFLLMCGMGGQVDVGVVANYFGVSTEVAMRHGKQMGVLR